MSIQTRFITPSVISCAAVGTVGQQAKKRIENAEQLPVHSYPVPGRASVLLTDDVAFKGFVAELQKDLENADEYIFYDCSAESPKGRRSVCYDREALGSRKEHKALKITPLIWPLPWTLSLG